MKTRILFVAVAALMIGFGACQSQPEYCTVKGTIKGVKDGTRLELQDEFDHFKAVAKTRVKDGAFEFRPRVAGPTHVYLYSQDGDQLKDFFLEPGTVIADVDATDADDWAVCASGTPANDFSREVDLLYLHGEDDAADARWEEIIDAGENGVLALYYARNVSKSAIKSLGVLDRLAPDVAGIPYISELREELARRAKAEPAPEGSEPNYFIDMTYPDMDGKMVSLSSVVNDPATRYVLLDFWATWCDPCREAIPELREIYAKYHDKGLEIYSVSEDADKESWESYVPENGMVWINVLDPDAGRSNSEVWSAYALHGIPTAILLDGETGAILARSTHLDLDSLLSSLL